MTSAEGCTSNHFAPPCAAWTLRAWAWSLPLPAHGASRGASWRGFVPTPIVSVVLWQTALEDVRHLLWACPANDSITDTAVVATQHLRAAALAGFNPKPSFWGRGLIAAGSVTLPPPLAEAMPLQWGLLPPLPEQGPTFVGTDGSCFHHTDALSARCGWAVVFSQHGKVCGAIYGPLCGQRQTVPRSELFAALMAAQSIHTDLVIFSDCLHIVQGFAAGEGKLEGRANQDL